MKDLREIIAYIESKQDPVTFKDLQKQFNLPDGWSCRGIVRSSPQDNNAIVWPRVEGFRKELPTGVWRLDNQIFTPHVNNISLITAQDIIAKQLHNSAVLQDVLIKDIQVRRHSNGFRYDVEFYPARYSKGTQTLVLDILQETSKHERAMKMAQYQGSWLLASYHEQHIKNPCSQPYQRVVDELYGVLRAKYPDLGLPNRFSQEFKLNQILPLTNKAVAVPGFEHVAFDPQSNTYVIRPTIPEHQYERATRFISNVGKRFGSITFGLARKATPALGLLVAGSEIAQANDKVDESVKQATVFAGGVTGAGLGALAGTWGGPPGMLAGALLGGYFGGESAGLSHQIIKDRNSSASAHSKPSVTAYPARSSGIPAPALAVAQSSTGHLQLDVSQHTQQLFNRVSDPYGLRHALDSSSFSSSAAAAGVRPVGPSLARSHEKPNIAQTKASIESTGKPQPLHREPMTRREEPPARMELAVTKGNAAPNEASATPRRFFDVPDNGRSDVLPTKSLGQIKPRIHQTALQVRTNINGAVLSDVFLDANVLEQQMRQAESAQEKFFELIPQLARESQKNFFTPETRRALNEIGADTGNLGIACAQISGIALRLGGHERTWQGANTVGNGLMTLGSSLSALSGLQAGLSLGAVTGGLGAVLGIVTIVDGFMGKSSGPSAEMQMMQGLSEQIDALQQQMLHCFRQLHKSMERGFQALNKRLLEQSMITNMHLNQISGELSNLGQLISFSFQELQLTDLIRTIDKIGKDISVNFSLSYQDRRQLLSELSTWIDCHSKSSIQTFKLQERGIKDCVKILGHDDFHLMTMFPFFWAQLIQLLPAPMLLKLNVPNLPNIAVLSKTCEVYINAIFHYKFDDDYASLLEPARNSFKQILSLIDAIKENDEVFEIIYRQYDYIRSQINQKIEKYVAETRVSGPKGASLQDILAPGVATEHILQLLEQLELRRLILIHIAELCDYCSAAKVKIDALESKAAILNGPAPKFSYVFPPGKAMSLRQSIAYRRANPAGYRVSDSMRVKDIVSALQTFPQQPKDLLAKFHYLIKYGDAPIPKDHLFVNEMGLAILLVACGHTPYIADLLHRQSGWQIMVLKNYDQETLSVKYYKSLLQKAYTFYQKIESGIGVPPDGVSLDCILLLVAILGDLKPLQALNKSREAISEAINRLLTKSNFSLLMLAVSCGAESAVDYFLENGADVDVKCASLPKQEASHLLFISIERQHWNIATKLIKHGIKPTEAQSEKIKVGLRVPLVQSSQQKYPYEFVQQIQRAGASQVSTPARHNTLVRQVRADVAQLDLAIQSCIIMRERSTIAQASVSSISSCSANSPHSFAVAQNIDTPGIAAIAWAEETTELKELLRSCGEFERLLERHCTNFCSVDGALIALAKEEDKTDIATQMNEISRIIQQLGIAMSVEGVANPKARNSLLKSLSNAFNLLDTMLLTFVKPEYYRISAGVRDIIQKLNDISSKLEPFGSVAQQKPMGVYSATPLAKPLFLPPQTSRAQIAFVTEAAQTLIVRI